MATAVNRDSQPEKNASGKRLDGWKEIAAYLGRVERTVKRWGAERGLPTHRLPGKGKTAVFAFTEELDVWMVSRRSQELDATEEDEQPAPPPVVEMAPLLPVEPVLPQSNEIPEQAFPAIERRRSVGPSRPAWRMAFTGMIVAGMFGAAVYAVVLRPAGNWFLHGASGFFTSSQPAPAATIPVSDSERAEAHQLYLKGRYEWDQRTADSLNRALDDFTQALVHDPTDAEAYVGLADTYDLLREYSTMPESEAYKRATLAARKAVALNDSLEEAHRALAFAEYWGDWNFVDGEKEFRRAIDLNPRDPLAHKWFANAISIQGRFSQSLAEIEKARELDPSSHSLLADKGITLYGAGKTQEAIALLREVERSAPEFLSPHVYLSGIGFELRDWPTFLQEGELAAQITNDPILKDTIAEAKNGYQHQGESGLLAALYAKQKQYFRQGKLIGSSLAATCLMMGHRQEALSVIEECYARHDPSTLHFFHDPMFRQLKDEPRFKAVRNRINLPAESAPPLPSGTAATTLAHLGASLHMN